MRRGNFESVRPDGKVLVAGGTSDNTEQVALASAEICDPSTGKWSATGSLDRAGVAHGHPVGKVALHGGCPRQEDGEIGPAACLLHCGIPEGRLSDARVTADDEQP